MLMERSWSTIVDIQCELLTDRPLENTKALPRCHCCSKFKLIPFYCCSCGLLWAGSSRITMDRIRNPFSSHTPACRPDKRSRSTQRSLLECFPSSPSDRMPFISWWPSVEAQKFGAERLRERFWIWARPLAIPKDRHFVPFMLICPAVEGELNFITNSMLMLLSLLKAFRNQKHTENSWIMFGIRRQ